MIQCKKCEWKWFKTIKETWLNLPCEKCWWRWDWDMIKTIYLIRWTYPNWDMWGYAWIWDKYYSIDWKEKLKKFLETYKDNEELKIITWYDEDIWFKHLLYILWIEWFKKAKIEHINRIYMSFEDRYKDPNTFIDNWINIAATYRHYLELLKELQEEDIEEIFGDIEDKKYKTYSKAKNNYEERLRYFAKIHAWK